MFGTKKGGFLKELDNNEIEAILVILEFLELSRFFFVSLYPSLEGLEHHPIFWGAKNQYDGNSSNFLVAVEEGHMHQTSSNLVSFLRCRILHIRSTPGWVRNE